MSYSASARKVKTQFMTPRDGNTFPKRPFSCMANASACGAKRVETTETIKGKWDKKMKNIDDKNCIKSGGISGAECQFYSGFMATIAN